MTEQTSIYIAGFCPLMLHGLEFVLKQEHFKFEKKIVSDAPSSIENSKNNFLLLFHLRKNFDENRKSVGCFLKRYPLSRIIVLSENCKQPHIKAFFKLGIRGYVLPTIGDVRLKQAIHEVLAGKSFLDPSISKKWIDMTFHNSKPNAELTRREEEVLDLIIEEYTTKEIGQKLFISSCTAETHRINIIRKLGVRNTAGVVREAMRMGR